MKYFFSTALLFILPSGLWSESGLMEILTGNAGQYNKAFPSEYVYLITDKTFYKPGDELWFKAIAENTLNNLTLSNDLNIKLIDVFGKQVLNIRYPLIENESKGYLLLPAYITEGKYQLIGYTGWMKNLSENIAFCKEIIISNHIDRNCYLSVSFPDILHYPGSKAEAFVKITLPDGSPFFPARFSYTLRTPKRKLLHGWAATDENGNSKINFVLPPETDSDILWLEFIVKHKKKSETFIEALPVVRKQIEIQFFPEGGRLIAGTENKVAFKACDQYGFPAEIEGYLLDETGKQLGRIKSRYMGLGEFTIIPEQGNYAFRLIKPVPEQFIFPLPDIQAGGIQLKYSGAKNGNIIFSLKSTAENKKEKVYFIAEQKGIIVWTKEIEFVNNEIVMLPVGELSCGIIKCTLLDDLANIVAVRNVAVFSDENKERPDINISKDIYEKREKIFISIKNTSDAGISASLAVSKSNHINSPVISLHQYLNHFIWLKDAGSEYFENILPNEHIDLIMQTHAVKSLPLTGLYNNDYKYSLPYYNQDGITGQVFDKKRNLQENARVKIIHTPDLRTFQASSDARGIFNIKFDNRIINYDLLNVAIADESGKSSNNYTVYDHYTENILKNHAKEKEEWQFGQITDLLKYKNPLLLYSGKYSHGREKKSKEFTGKGYNYKKYSLYSSAAEIIAELKSYNLVNNEIVFIGHESSIDNQHGALIVVDGIALGTNAAILNAISPKDIRHISVSTLPVDIQRYSALNSMGVIEIFTIRSDENTGNEVVREIQKDILMLDHTFNVPDYSLGDIPGNDTRTTLYWNPDFIIESGSESVIAFYASDIAGDYTCVITGTDQKGKLLSQRAYFKVK